MSNLEQKIVDYYVGLDLGQSHDYTAVAIVEKVTGAKGFDYGGKYVDVWLPEEETVYNVLHLERFPLGTSYPKIVESIATRVLALPIAGKGTVNGGMPDRYMVVDATGVGRPVVDLLRDANVGDTLIPVTIHGGNAVTNEDGYYNVPKRDLIGALQVLMQQKRLKVAEGLPEAKTLIQELRNYRYKLTASAHDTYNAREGTHDDLVLALGVAVWYARKNILAWTDPDVVDMLLDWRGR